MKSTFFAALLAALSSSNAFADIILQYDFAGQPGNQTSTSPSFEAPGVSGLDVVRGDGLDATAADNSMNSTIGGVAPGVDNEYFSFGFTTSATRLVTLESLQIQTRSSNTGPGTIGLFSSSDGFTNPIETITQGGGSFVNSTVDLSALPSILNSSIEFRLIEIGNTQADGMGATTNGGTFRVANFQGAIPVTFNGTITTVPEPSSLALLGFVVSIFLVGHRHFSQETPQFGDVIVTTVARRRIAGALATKWRSHVAAGFNPCRYPHLS